MGDVVKVDFDGSNSFRREMDDIIEDLVTCLTRHYGEYAGNLMAKSFIISMDMIAERLTKQLKNNCPSS